MEYLSTTQASEKWGILSRRIQILCLEDRIPGAMRIGNYWAIPEMQISRRTLELKAGIT